MFYVQDDGEPPKNAGSFAPRQLLRYPKSPPSGQGKSAPVRQQWKINDAAGKTYTPKRPASFNRSHDRAESPFAPSPDSSYDRKTPRTISGIEFGSLTRNLNPDPRTLSPAPYFMDDSEVLELQPAVDFDHLPAPPASQPPFTRSRRSPARTGSPCWLIENRLRDNKKKLIADRITPSARRK
ncbi:MAG: hypothetical protein WD875_06875 [Pirellulales bacterium]